MFSTTAFKWISWSVFFGSFICSAAHAQQRLETCSYSRQGGSFQLRFLQYTKSYPQAGRPAVRNQAQMVDIDCRTEKPGLFVCYRDNGKIRMDVRFDEIQSPLVALRLSDLQTGLSTMNPIKYCYSERTPTRTAQCTFDDGSDLTTDLDPRGLRVVEGARRDVTRCEKISAQPTETESGQVVR